MKSIIEYILDCGIVIEPIKGLPAHLLVSKQREIVGEIGLINNVRYFSVNGIFYSEKDPFENSQLHQYLKRCALKAFW